MAEGLQEDPQVQQAREDVAHCKEAIADALVEYDDIDRQQNPHISSDYAIKVGVYENELLKSDVAARRAKRKLTLAQKAINAGKPLDDGALEAQLEGEFREWQERMAKALEDYLKALDYREGTKAMKPDEAAKMKKLYRVLVKRLHPDLHPDLTSQQRDMFLRAQVAYENGDVAALEAIEVSTREGAGGEDGSGASAACGSVLDDLKAELALLEATLSVFAQRVDDLKARAPYCYKDKLEDKNWVVSQVEQLKAQTEANNKAAAEYMRRYEDLKGTAHG